MYICSVIKSPTPIHSIKGTAMKWFTHEELIDEIVAHLKIKSIGDGKWKVTSHIDKQNGKIELSMITPKQIKRGELREQRNKQFAKDLLKELIHKKILNKGFLTRSRGATGYGKPPSVSPMETIQIFAKISKNLKKLLRQHQQI